MPRALLVKTGLLLSSVSTIAVGLAFWLLPKQGAGGIGFDSGDRVAGAGLIACGVLFAVMALLVRSDRERSSPDPPTEA
ncbi:MAG: hypothetical protein ACYTGX_10105 [Planctomycetota bacterium]|jgi:hypothetical protein